MYVLLNTANISLISNKISSTIVYDDYETGLMLHTNPGGRPSKLDLDNNLMRENIADLRLSHGSTSKMLLLLSFSTDLMIRSLHMYPEVWFLDVTARSNKQKRNLFVLVGRKPSGNSFISNVTLIPSGKFCCVCTLNLYCTFC